MGTIPLPKKKYKIIYADPPYYFKTYSKKGESRSATKHYDCMGFDDICNMPVSNIADMDCVLFMWVTDSHLQEGLKVIKSWGFNYKTIGFTWVKHYASGSTCYNFSPYLLKSTEICLIGMKGKLVNIKERNDIKGLVADIRTKHSKKPEEVRKRIEQMCKDLPRIELFARHKTDGWDVWGNEV